MPTMCAVNTLTDNTYLNTLHIFIHILKFITLIEEESGISMVSQLPLYNRNESDERKESPH